jgi:hypothetical protein
MERKNAEMPYRRVLETTLAHAMNYRESPVEVPVSATASLAALRADLSAGMTMKAEVPAARRHNAIIIAGRGLDS